MATRKNVEAVVSAMGVLLDIVVSLVAMLKAKGASVGEAIYKLGTSEGRKTLEQIAELIVNASKSVPAEETVKPLPTPTPADNEEFTLTINGDAVDPLEMVRSDGYDPEKWQFLGPAVQGTHTKIFVLLDLGYCSNRDEAKQKAKAKGYTLAEGQWRMPFRQKFPKPTRSIAAVFGGSEWLSPGDGRRVPCLSAFGRTWSSDFPWSGLGFGEYCRWAASRE